MPFLVSAVGPYAFEPRIIFIDLIRITVVGINDPSLDTVSNIGFGTAVYIKEYNACTGTGFGNKVEACTREGKAGRCSRATVYSGSHSRTAGVTGVGIIFVSVNIITIAGNKFIGIVV